jgi:hypothetical protein
MSDNIGVDTEPSMKLDISANKDSECMTSEHVSTNRANCISNASAKVPLTTTLQLPYFNYRLMKLSSLIDNFLRLLIVAEYVQELQTLCTSDLTPLEHFSVLARPLYLQSYQGPLK